MKIYTSFEEIDQDLKILRLKKDIHKEEMKLRLHEAKENFSFLGILGNSAGYLFKKAMILKLFKKLF